MKMNVIFNMSSNQAILNLNINVSAISEQKIKI